MFKNGRQAGKTGIVQGCNAKICFIWGLQGIIEKLYNVTKIF